MYLYMWLAGVYMYGKSGVFVVLGGRCFCAKM